MGTGVPGVTKSAFIEGLELHLRTLGYWLVVLVGVGQSETALAGMTDSFAPRQLTNAVTIDRQSREGWSS